MQQSRTFFNELTFDQLAQLAERRYALKINPRTNSESLRTVNKQLNQFKELLEYFYFNPDGFDPSPFFKLDPFLVYNFLRLSHVYYLDKKIPEIEQYIFLLNKSNNSPKTRVLILLFNEYKKNLRNHIALEENEIFPLIQQIIESRSDDKLFCKSAQLRSQLATFYVEHADTEQELNYMRSLVAQLNFSERGISTVLSNQLALLEADLMLHHILEEEILIPAVLDVLA